MSIRATFFAAIAGIGLSAPSQAAEITSETVETIPSQPGYTQTFIFDRVANPVASLIMYPGSKGHIGIFPNGSAQLDAFIVYRARKLFAAQGFNVALLDTPSEWGIRGIWEKQRSPEYAAHNAAAIAWLRQQANVPVFLLGFSAGAIAATGVATQLGDKGADGLILLSPWMPPKEKWPIPNFVFDAAYAIPSWPDLNRIQGPMLIVHHLEDNCNFSLPEFVPNLVSALSAARKPDVIGFQGGASPSGNACYPTGRNNFNGLEREVAEAVGNWVRRAVSAKPAKQ